MIQFIIIDALVKKNNSIVKNDRGIPHNNQEVAEKKCHPTTGGKKFHQNT